MKFKEYLEQTNEKFEAAKIKDLSDALNNVDGKIPAKYIDDWFGTKFKSVNSIETIKMYTFEKNVIVNAKGDFSDSDLEKMIGKTNFEITAQDEDEFEVIIDLKKAKNFDLQGAVEEISEM